MIADNQTNTLYISCLLKEKHPQFHHLFFNTLQSVGINVNYLHNTKDIWCRDYMPIQRDKNQFVQFKFEPSYLDFKKYVSIKTNPKDVWGEMGIKVSESSIVLDGGNVVKSATKAILTNRISKDNPDISEQGLYQTIKRELGVGSVIIIPELKGEITGHSDGIVRFIDEDFVLINDFSKTNKSYGMDLKYCLLNVGISYIELPNELENAKTSLDARGDYINFLEIGDVVLIPSYKYKMDDVALLIYKELFRNKQVIQIDCNEIAVLGGALNCITWTIKKG